MMSRRRLPGSGASRVPRPVSFLALFVLPMSILATLGDAAPAAAAAIACGGSPATIVGTPGADHLVGTNGNDVIVGLGGNDVIEGRAGDDDICGGGKADQISGGSGNDRIWGGGGNDIVDGDEGNDHAIGGKGTDTCAGAETRSTCEAVPPPGCTNARRVPAEVTATNVKVVGSNAYPTQSTMLIDGEGRRLTFVAEVRNDTGDMVRLGQAKIVIHDGAGDEIGRRWVYPEADALAPGQRTVLTETVPSWLYWSNETNDFPEGWKSWTLTLNATKAPATSNDDVVIRSTLKSLGADAEGDLTARGTATNSLNREIDSATWWVVLYDDAGRLVNVGQSYLYESMSPGDTAGSETTIWSDEPACFASVSWGAAGS